MQAGTIKVLLTTLAVAGMASVPATVAAQGRESSVAVFSARVPQIVKLVVDPTAQTSDGYPVLRVISNVPGIRALGLRGVAPEVLRQAEVRYAVAGRGNGGEAAIRGDATVEPGLVRYTIAQP